MKITVKPDVIGEARAEIASRSLRKQIKSFVCVTDNDWFAFLSPQSLLPKTAHHSATQLADKKDGG